MSEFAIIRTSGSTTREGMVFSGGSYLKKVSVAFSAILVRHNGDAFLFDSGLGLQVDKQYDREMPGWKKPLIWYGAVDAAKSQMERANVTAPRRIILSHGHWDHASALVDFPEAEVWVTAPEREFIRHGHDCGALKAGSVMASQFEIDESRWHLYDFEDKPFENFEKSLDLYGDGKVVLVPLAGHTPGSVALWVTVDSGKRFLFCGDTVWSAGAIAMVRPKMFFASAMVDSDPAGTRRAIGKLRDARAADANLTVVPAHDGAVQESIGYFPTFVR